ncbi:hypothetical protein VB566_06175 [Clostridium perfringens]|uniref:hypothetical protein n=1 Tax=Clostridium perfringens TaxID=1502 RepID=UPI001CCC2A8B|nr:hypothetical protein [Clostridium perfringens]MDH5097598.1 hypothetical protein [Clostridium perfringens]MDM0704150.1 hypothetical protein [Clostridium perfringens]MEA5270187.1 hypothetical protein [Clostridium perfringens]MEA5310476.1 hypothetical protein [Clostridium perfringens]MEA5340684.1 hypothetical protein [Clostridium perfringens]
MSKYLIESQLDDLKLIEVKEVVILPLGESEILRKIPKNNMSNSKKVPLFPIIDKEGNTTFNELRLNKDYTLNKDIEIYQGDTWSDVKNGMVNSQSERYLAKHFNDVVVQEISSITKSHELTNLEEMLSKRTVGVNYSLVASKKHLEELLKLKNASGESMVKVVNGEFVYDNQINILVVESIDNLSMISLDELLVRLIGDTKEIKQTVELFRQGKKAWNTYYDIGLAFINESNVFSSLSI